LALLLVVSAASLGAQESFEAEFRRGLVALNGKDLVQARQSLESASRLKPDNALVWAALAETYLHSKETKQANEAAERAAGLAPADPAVEHALAVFYSETEDFKKAAEWERRFAGSSAADPQAPARAAELSLRAGDTEQAVQWAKKAGQPDLLGQAYAAANQPDAAEREFRKAVEQDPKVEAFVFDLGQVQLRRGEFSEALATFEQGRQRFPASAQMHLAYGVAAYGQRRFSDAIDAFLRVTQIDASVEQPYVFLARMLDQAGDRLPQVVAAYAAWEKAEPGNYLAVCLHAKALGAAGGDPAEIETRLRRSIQLNDRYWESHFELGVLLLQQRLWQAAAVELARSVELNPKNAPAHFQLARAYDKLGKPELARAEREEHQRLTADETGVVKAP
jgi:tetratricopeptide (TPR) repeat protein